MTRTKALNTVADAARTAHDLHEEGLVQRDIKPENVLLHENGAKLSDLGLAQVVSPGRTLSGLGPIDSVEYLDPAILRGQRPSRSTDIWSLGMTLHRALTGVGVYGNLPQEDPLLALRRVMGSSPQLDPSLGPAEADVITRCLDPDPARRPATAKVVAEAIAGLPAGVGSG